MTIAEQCISKVEDVGNPLQAEVCSIHTNLSDHASNLSILKGHPRRNNPRFVGFREGWEDREQEHFMENWLKSILKPGTLSPLFAIERAHQVPLRPVP